MIKILLLIITILLTACSPSKERELILSTNAWIGYVPLFYAKEKGYLDTLNIKLITNVSLGESLNIFLISKADMLTTTQHEYNILKNEINNVIPIILVDRSNGGDMILSNKTIDELQKSQKIDVYLEVDSINKEMIEDFTRIYHLDPELMNFINKDQAQIQNIKFNNSKDIVIVTYVPNNIKLEKQGFIEIASTKNENSLLVIDMICTTKKLAKEEKERLKKLKAIIDISIKEIMQDTESAHALTKHYLDNLTYEEFLDSLDTIKWINTPSQELLKRIDSMGYKKENLF